MPFATWVIIGQGAGLNWVQFKAMWRIIKEPEKACIDDVHNLFFYRKGQGLHGSLLDSDLSNSNFVLWDVNHEEAKQMA